NISFIIPKELRDDLKEIMEQLARGERVEREETVRVRKDGTRIDVSLVISPIRDPAGRLVGASTIARDIGEQKRAAGERARLSLMVERERERLRNLVADVPGVVWEAWGVPDDATQHIDFVSDHVEKMLGYTVEEWLSTPNFWLSIVHPDDRERAAREAHQIYESRTGGTSRFRWVRRDGRAVHVEAQSRIILDERGRPAGMRGVTIDITARQRGEERLRFLAEASRVLGSSLDYETTLAGLARLAVSALADYCLVDLVDDDGRVRRVAATHRDPALQPLAERLREYPPGQQPAGVPAVLRTGKPELMSHVDDEAVARLARDEEHARVLGELGLKSFITVPLVARGRTIGALTFSSTRQRREYDEEDVAYAQEIAARAALAIENARLYGRAQEVNRAKDEFLATLSHELRTPLTPILGWTHMIRSGRLGSAEIAQGVRVIEKNSQALSRLINDLLDMSSILSGKMRIERAPVELQAVVREAVETVRPQAAARRVSIEVEPGGGASVSLDGDRTRLVQVFWNLLNNAVKFSSEGGLVRVRVGAKDGTARVEVEDDGDGIAPEFLPHVFERFRQADGSTTRTHGGLGLGLALVKSFVEAHGGSVAAESAGEGRGSRFTVRLPTLETTERPRPSGDLDPNAAAPCAEEPCHVLLVEDAPDTLEMLRVVFEARGYTAAACATPEEALRVAESGRFDIIVSDIGLPRIDGYELIRRLRELPHLREVPALALTGYAAPRDAEAALGAGFDAHVPKPVDPSALAERMEQLVRRKGEGEPGV
ncbi:MAG TPA: ATP-binding protein, partial [Pyrinomonadaceae bacterium]|nr:ATP-binding protein [Pyrinomonadaceae bacterium]